VPELRGQAKKHANEVVMHVVTSGPIKPLAQPEQWFYEAKFRKESAARKTGERYNHNNHAGESTVIDLIIHEGREYWTVNKITAY
jgi:hypothetical protein